MHLPDPALFRSRVVDTKARRVNALAGNGTQGRDYNGGKSGHEQSISTPWDVLVEGGQVFIAMAGTHQIWSYEIGSAHV